MHGSDQGHRHQRHVAAAGRVGQFHRKPPARVLEFDVVGVEVDVGAALTVTEIRLSVLGMLLTRNNSGDRCNAQVEARWIKPATLRALGSYSIG